MSKPSLREQVWRWLEEAAPLKGRWLSAVLSVGGYLLLLWLVSFGLVLTDQFSPFLRAQNVRLSLRPAWRLERDRGRWSPLVVPIGRMGKEIGLQVGPCRWDYYYPGRGQREDPGDLKRALLLASHWSVVLLGWLAGRAAVPSRRLRRFTGWYLAGMLGLEFPLLTACGWMGCQTLHGWRVVAGWMVSRP